MAIIEVHWQKIKWKKIWKYAYILIFLIAIFAAGVFFYQYKKMQELLNNPQKRVQEEIQDYTNRIGAVMVLPKEEPTLATVSNVDKLKNQPFFTNAKNGDKVLIYTAARTAILYRPSWGKIIEVGPINLGGIATPSATVSPTPTISLPAK